jgi:membrane-bound lytic murein transglycosylase B
MRRSVVSLVALAAAMSGAGTACSTRGDAPVAAPTTSTSSSSTSTTETTAPPTTTTAAAATGAEAAASLPPGARYPISPSSASAAAADLSASAQVINDVHASDAALAAAADKQQAAIRAIVIHPDWLASVKAAVSPALRGGIDANVTAGQELRILTKPRDTLPPWRIVEPAPAAELLADYRAAEAATGVPWQYLAAINLTETRMGRIRGNSTAGAQGPMQFLPATWARYGNGGDINNPRDAIAAAARLLKADGAPGNMAGAIYAYNHSDHYVRAVTLYAQQMQADERAYYAYHQWRVYYRLVTGDVVLDVGYAA